MKKHLFLSIVLTLLFTFSGTGVAMTIDGDLADWGLNPPSDWTPDAGILGVEEDSTQWYVGPGVGGNTFDAEGMYAFYSDGDESLYISIVTGVAPGGSTYNGTTYPPGDIEIDFGGGNVFGIETTGASAGDVVLNPDWTTPTDFPSSAPSNMIGGTGTDVGVDAVLAYNSDAYGTDHYVIELCVSDDAFGSLWGQGFNLYWTMECGNDFIELQFPPVPEPATSLLLGIGLASVAMARRRQKRLS